VRFWLAAAADAVAVSTFAAVGRRSHADRLDLAGGWHIAWPFLAGAAIGTLVGRTWRRPESLASGVVVWAGTLIGGMTLRALSGGGVQPSFVVIAGLILAGVLLGWRAVCLLLRRIRSRATAPAAP
jgi:Protein of unknown function (DUF3054)